jgi:DNA-binding NarL/FixJ family response regulator
MAQIYIFRDAMKQLKQRATQGARALSDRQREIAALVCAGHSNKTIARSLGLTEGTIKTHLHAIFVRLRVKDRAGLIHALSTDI